MNGKCWFCGEPVYNHSKLCERHYNKSLEYAKKSKEARIKMSKTEQKKFKEQMLRVQMNRISNEQQKRILNQH